MKQVYVVCAVQTDGPVDGDGEPMGAFEVYAIGATKEIAQAIIDQDVRDGQIYDNAFIEKVNVTETMEQV